MVGGVAAGIAALEVSPQALLYCSLLIPVGQPCGPPCATEPSSLGTPISSSSCVLRLDAVGYVPMLEVHLGL